MHIEFDNAFLRELPGDPEAGPRVREVLGAALSPVEPTPVAAPRLLAASQEAAALVGLDASTFTDPDFAGVFGGNMLLPGMQPRRPTTADTSSAAGPGSSATAVRSRWARRWVRTADAGSCS